MYSLKTLNSEISVI